jgi:Signal transduction histidine kinase
MVLIRAAQEALSNVRRHAHASSCEVWLRVDEQAATLQIQDDGVGLLDGTYERPHLHALRALRYRVAELDGQLAVFEGERGGLIVRVTLPLDS